MKHIYFILFASIIFTACKNEQKSEHFEGKWQMISLLKDGKPSTLPKDTTNGVLKIINKQQGLYFFQVFDVRFPIKKTDGNYLKGTYYTVFVRYLPENDHIIFDMENDASIMEFKRIK